MVEGRREKTTVDVDHGRDERIAHVCAKGRRGQLGGLVRGSRAELTFKDLIMYAEQTEEERMVAHGGVALEHSNDTAHYRNTKQWILSEPQDNVSFVKVRLPALLTCT